MNMSAEHQYQLMVEKIIYFSLNYLTMTYRKNQTVSIFFLSHTENAKTINI